MHRGGFGNTRLAGRKTIWYPAKTGSYLPPSKPTSKTVDHVPSPDFVAGDTSELQPGQRVEHQKFGFGEVLKWKALRIILTATVKFEHNGEKKIMLNYAKLRIM